MKFIAALILAGLTFSLPNHLRADNGTSGSAGWTNAAEGFKHGEELRMACIDGRRMICGRILRVLPDGLVVDSGYADLMREPLNKSWLFPGTVAASRPPNQVESREPGAICVGPIFLVDMPKIRGAGAKPKQYDYVTLLAYPVGQHTYHSVGDVYKTVREFSGTLQKAVDRKLAAEYAASTNAPVAK